MSKMIECYEHYYGVKWEGSEQDHSDFDQKNWQAAWNASRESIVVELPGIYDFKSTSGMRRGCQEAIEAQGLKVK